MNKLICYCLKYTEKDIKDDFEKNGKSLIAEEISNTMKTGKCDCFKNHPEGR